MKSIQNHSQSLLADHASRGRGLWDVYAGVLEALDVVNGRISS